MKRGSTVIKDWRARFWAKVQKGNGCWLWKSSTRNRYPVFTFGRKFKAAHRLSWEMANGPIPEGCSVLHRCDTPLCVRPDHLFVGSQADNMRDMREKGRARKFSSAKGERCSSAKLTVAIVRAIRLRAQSEQKKRLAIEFGVAPSTIGDIVSRKSWKHVGEAP